ncbi:hypothetical protein [Neisseria polysaccharea]|uniref:hypothetical protein n=1 Tax=Neisseria polysaccharea TaxID=489 RepID=UPI0034E4D570
MRFIRRGNRHQTAKQHVICPVLTARIFGNRQIPPFFRTRAFLVVQIFRIRFPTGFAQLDINQQQADLFFIQIPHLAAVGKMFVQLVAAYLLFFFAFRRQFRAQFCQFRFLRFQQALLFSVENRRIF